MISRSQAREDPRPFLPGSSRMLRCTKTVPQTLFYLNVLRMQVSDKNGKIHSIDKNKEHFKKYFGINELLHIQKF